MVLDCTQHMQHRWIFVGGWYIADERPQRLVRMAVSVSYDNKTWVVHEADCGRFLIEGLLTLVIGVFSFGLMPPGACQTAHWFRGKKGWFNEHEEHILVNRILRDDPSKGDMNNRYDSPS